LKKIRKSKVRPLPLAGMTVVREKSEVFNRSGEQEKQVLGRKIKHFLRFYRENADFF